MDKAEQDLFLKLYQDIQEYADINGIPAELNYPRHTPKSLSGSKITLFDTGKSDLKEEARKPG